ncbi:phosphotransferase [Phytohabitans kaempferiae]|uniref:Phosphotransferase n=1 Tax=Phytohabitans kaempferiae TaxID=1620943 RepID=A0ABV6MB63_9ACTN
MRAPTEESIVDGNDWTSPAWRAAADQWVSERLAARGTPVTGPIEQHRVRPWSVTHRAPTTAGWHWFKANTFGCRYEAPLAEALAAWAPEAVLPPVAVHAARGWLLTADAGAILRETGRLEDWAAFVEEYAELQRALAHKAEAMVALGVPDQRPSLLPELLGGLLEDPVVRAGLGTERVAAVEAVVPDVAEWCAELAADGVAASLQHDDLHDGNVFAGPYRFFDWGDASVAHPFGTLLVTLSSATYRFGLAPGDAELLRLRDAYLSGWSGGAAALRRSATLACRVTRLSRALSWWRALDRSALPVADEWRSAPAEWLAELTEPDVV